MAPRKESGAKTSPGQAPAIIEQDGFESFYAAHVDAVTKFIARRVGDGSSAADLASDTFATAFARRRDFRGSSHEEQRAWAMMIARTRLNHHYRRLETERRALVHADNLRRDSADSHTLLVERLAGALSQLPDEQRVAIVERVILDRDYATIAAQHGVSEQTVRARVSRGLKALAQQLN